jgi:pilus assembly protein CpaB
MKNKTVILLCLAVGCGLLAAFLTSKLLSQRSAPPQDEEEKVMLLVAKQKLTYGTKLDVPENYLEVKEYPLDQAPQNALHNVEEARGKMISITYLPPGTFVTKDHLIDAQSVGIQGDLPQGKRAVGIRTNAVATAGGLIVPRSHVDVMLTTATETKVILSDILVRAVDTHLKQDANSPIIPQTVTLEVDPEQAAILRLAEKTGDISLSVRPLGDKLDTTRITVSPDAFGKRGMGTNKSADGTAGGSDLTAPKTVELMPKAIGTEVSKPDTVKSDDDPAPTIKKRKAFMQELYNGSEKIVLYFDDQTNKLLKPADYEKYELPTCDK